MMKSARSGSFTAFNGPLMRLARGIKNLPFVAHTLNTLSMARAKAVQKVGVAGINTTLLRKVWNIVLSQIALANQYHLI